MSVARDNNEQEATIIQLRARIAELEEQLAATVIRADMHEVSSPRQHRVEASVDSDPGEVKIAEKRDLSRASSPEPQKEVEKATPPTADHWLSTIFRNPLTPASTPVKNLANLNKVRAPQAEPVHQKKKALPRRLSLARATAAMTLGSPAIATVGGPKKEDSIATSVGTPDVSSTLRQTLTSEPSPPLAAFGWFQPSV
jgi:hypothetical protein